MPQKKEIKIVNGDLVGYCLPQALSQWEKSGWTAADDENSESEQRAQDIEPSQGVSEDNES